MSIQISKDDVYSLLDEHGPASAQELKTQFDNKPSFLSITYRIRELFDDGRVEHASSFDDNGNQRWKVV